MRINYKDIVISKLDEKNAHFIRIMPSLSYSLDVFTSSGSQQMISIVMIDTIRLCGQTKSDNAASSPVHASLTSSKIAISSFADLETKLATVNATSVPYILVAGHYPVWSVSQHGPTKCLVDRLQPLLHKYGVSAYICGHDHNLQHIQNTYQGTTVDYILSGSGAYTMNSKSNQKKLPANSFKYYWGGKGKMGGIASIRADLDKMTVTFYQSDQNKQLYQTEIKPRKV